MKIRNLCVAALLFSVLAGGSFVLGQNRFKQEAVRPADSQKPQKYLRIDSTQQREIKPKEVFGRIQLVDRFPDVKVQIVKVNADLRVQKVDVFANDAGKWQIVDTFPDYKVQIVNAFPDFTIQWVDVFPGEN